MAVVGRLWPRMTPIYFFPWSKSKRQIEQLQWKKEKCEFALVYYIPAVYFLGPPQTLKNAKLLLRGKKLWSGMDLWNNWAFILKAQLARWWLWTAISSFIMPENNRFKICIVRRSKVSHWTSQRMHLILIHNTRPMLIDLELCAPKSGCDDEGTLLRQMTTTAERWK